MTKRRRSIPSNAGGTAATRRMLMMVAVIPLLLLLLHSASTDVMVRADNAAPPTGGRAATDSYVINDMGAVDIYPINNAADDDANGRLSDSDAASANAVAAYQKLLDSYAPPDTSEKLKRKSAEHRSLQSKFDAAHKSVIQKTKTSLQKNEPPNAVIGEHFTKDENGTSPVDVMHADMDDATSKAAELARRTERVLARIARHNAKNLAELGAGLKDGQAEEMARRDRYRRAMAEELRRTKEEEEEAMVENLKNGTADEFDAAEGNRYISLSELSALLSPQKILGASESALENSLASLASAAMLDLRKNDTAILKERAASLPKYLGKQYEEAVDRIEQLKKGNNKSACLDVPGAMRMAGKALAMHHDDGIAIWDHATYENGASVVYELTSASYVPPPRNDDMVSAGGDGKDGRRRKRYEHEKRKMFDAGAEEMYRQHRAVMNDEGSNPSFADRLNEAWEGTDLRDVYGSFKFGEMRHRLPDDWERWLDAGFGESWSEYTTRGALDALVPDYVHRALGTSDTASYGAWMGRTAGPEVVISSGRSKAGGTEGGGGGGGWTAKPMGHCYPLSMDPGDDPALSLFSHDEDGSDASSSLLAGPKFTVRLPYPIYADAVTLEHRSFPLSKSELEGGSVSGGESAPRWVRVVGFPPCPTEEEDEEEDEGVEEDGCRARGFDIDRPIDLGSFEYRRITVTGREDDYGGGSSDDDEEDDNVSGDDAWPSERRRSVQTFAVRGGHWKPPSLLESDASQDRNPNDKKEKDDSVSTQCSEDSASCGAPPFKETEEEEEESPPPPGQCAPPKDEDSLPSCGGDKTDGASSPRGSGGAGARRHIVEAVSFIVEENWGNGDYTCLYRVRVHGDAVA